MCFHACVSEMRRRFRSWRFKQGAEDRSPQALAGRPPDQRSASARGPDVLIGAGRSPPTPTGRKVSKGAGRPAPSSLAATPRGQMACEARRVCTCSSHCGLIPGGGHRVMLEGSKRFGSPMPSPPSLPVIPDARSAIRDLCQAHVRQEVPDSLAPAFRPGLGFRDDGWWGGSEAASGVGVGLPRATIRDDGGGWISADRQHQHLHFKRVHDDLSSARLGLDAGACG
jgi:hypothetical protein